jgi:hypothetical protein
VVTLVTIPKENNKPPKAKSLAFVSFNDLTIFFGLVDITYEPK